MLAPRFLEEQPFIAVMFWESPIVVGLDLQQSYVKLFRDEWFIVWALAVGRGFKSVCESTIRNH